MECKRFVLLLSVLLLLFASAALGKESRDGVDMQKDWKREFALVCGKTQNAMTLPAKELLDYIERCDALKNRLSELTGSQGAERKIYAKRLEMCRNLYHYVLEYKNERK